MQRTWMRSRAFTSLFQSCANANDRSRLHGDRYSLKNTANDESRLEGNNHLLMSTAHSTLAFNSLKQTMWESQSADSQLLWHGPHAWCIMHLTCLNAETTISNEVWRLNWMPSEAMTVLIQWQTSRWPDHTCRNVAMSWVDGHKAIKGKDWPHEISHYAGSCAFTGPWLESGSMALHAWHIDEADSETCG